MARQGTTRAYGPDATDPVRLVGEVAAVLSIGAGVIHVSAAGDHTNLPVMFTGFLVVAALQVGLGFLLIQRRPSRVLIAAALALMLGSVAVWLLSRTEGLPFLEDGHTEPVGFKDGVTVLFELASVPALLLLLSRDLARASLPSPRLRSQTLAVLGAGCFALLPPALLLEGGGHHSHEQAVELGIHEDGHGAELAHAGPDAGHADGGDDHHAKGGGEKGAGGHKHAKSGKSGKHRHSDAVLASAPLGTGHDHSGGTSPDNARDHHGDEHGGGGDGQHKRGRHDGDKPHGDGHRGGDHGGHGKGDGGEGDEGEQPVRISYEPEPSVCVTSICFP